MLVEVVDLALGIEQHPIRGQGFDDLHGLDGLAQVGEALRHLRGETHSLLQQGLLVGTGRHRVGLGLPCLHDRDGLGGLLGTGLVLGEDFLGGLVQALFLQLRGHLGHGLGVRFWLVIAGGATGEAVFLQGLREAALAGDLNFGRSRFILG